MIFFTNNKYLTSQLHYNSEDFTMSEKVVDMSIGKITYPAARITTLASCSSIGAITRVRFLSYDSITMSLAIWKLEWKLIL